jgi:hypothetical protein
VRRTALAVACVLVAVAGVAAVGIFTEQQGNDDEAAAPAPAAETTVDVGAAEAPVLAAPSPGFLSKGQRVTLDSADEAAKAPLPPTGRATDVRLWMEVRLPGADELSAAAAEAMAITRELGGWVAASDIDTEGTEGRAELALRVPVGRVEDAVVRLGELGTVTGERVATVDLQTGIDQRDLRIVRLERAINELQLKLASGTLSPEEELRARLQVERHENAIEDLAAQREAATSELSLVLHTREAAAKEEKDEGGVAGAAGNALDFLAAAGTIALFLVIVLSPVVLLLVLLWLAFRARSRRVEARLLERTDPASPPSA